MLSRCLVVHNLCEQNFKILYYRKNKHSIIEMHTIQHIINSPYFNRTRSSISVYIFFLIIWSAALLARPYIDGLFMVEVRNRVPGIPLIYYVNLPRLSKSQNLIRLPYNYYSLQRVRDRAKSFDLTENS